MENNKSLEELVVKWSNFVDWITAPESGWSGYDLQVDDFEELKVIIDIAKQQI